MEQRKTELYGESEEGYGGERRTERGGDVRDVGL